MNALPMVAWTYVDGKLTPMPHCAKCGSFHIEGQHTRPPKLSVVK